MALKLRRIGIGFTLFIVVVVAALWLGSALVVSLNATKIATAIESSLGPGFEVGSVGGDLVQGLLIEGVAAGPDPAHDPSGDPILQAAKCRLVPNYIDLFSGKLTIQQIRFSDVTLVLRRQGDGSMLWPPFIARAATAQGANWTLSRFGWVLERAEITYYPIPDGKSIRAQVPVANGSFTPGGRFQIDNCKGTLNDASWELSVSLDQATKELSGIWRLREAGIWTLTQAFTEHRHMSLDAAALPTGIVSGSLNIAGTLSDPRLKGDLDWKEGTLRHFRVEQGDIKIDWRPGKLTFEDSVIKAYNGRLAASGSIDFRTQPPYYQFVASTEQMELGQFLADAGFGKLQLTGRYAGTMEGEGSLHDVGSLSGTAHVEATDGQTLNPLYDPAQQGSKQIIDYDSLKADLAIQRRVLKISNGLMTSKDMSLDGGGQVDFDGGLDLRGTLTAPGRLFVHHPQYGPAVQYLELEDTPVGLLLVVGGTLEVPDLTVAVDPATIQEAAKKGLLNRLKDIFTGGAKPEDPPPATSPE